MQWSVISRWCRNVSGMEIIGVPYRCSVTNVLENLKGGLPVAYLANDRIRIFGTY